MRTTNLLHVTLLAVGAGASAGCSTSEARPAAAASAADEHAAPTRRSYGEAVAVGEGRARAYVVYDQKNGGAPIELGVALDERAMSGLPAPNPHAAMKTADGHEHLDSHVYLLAIPGGGVEPFRFVELDWNPGGHEPPGVYDTPHFDFHFWTASRAEREAIVPSDPHYQRKADMLPADGLRPASYAVAAPPGAPAPGVPLMGVHWTDVRSPELQKVFGKPEAYRPFTTTFLYGSWEGRWTFLEPMITRAYILGKKTATDPALRDEVLPISTPARVAAAGYYPSAYRITWDEASREYRVALTNLTRRD